MVTARPQLVSGNLFLKNSNCCPTEKSVLGELDWFSGGNFSSESFPPEKFPPETFSAEKFPDASRKVSTGNFLPENLSPDTLRRKSFRWKVFRRKLFRQKNFPEFPTSGGNFRDGNLLEFRFRFIFSGNYNFCRKTIWGEIGCPILDLK